MAYEPYVSEEFYKDYSKVIPDEDIKKHLRQASRHVDSLTYNRIVENVEKLTSFQLDILQEVVCELADFEYNNKEQLASLLSSYSINGVSMTIGASKTTYFDGGIFIPSHLYSLLEQTGLTYRGKYRWVT